MKNLTVAVIVITTSPLICLSIITFICYNALRMGWDMGSTFVNYVGT